MKICRIEGCSFSVLATELCSGHYGRHRRGVDLEDPPLRPRRLAELPCSVAGCEDLIRSKNLCDFHYARHLGGVDLNADRKLSNKGKICKVDSCDREAKSLEFCNAHYDRFRKGESLERPIGEPKPIEKKWGDVCRVDWCDLPERSVGYCGAHHSRLLRGQNMDDPWRGTEVKKYINYNGYVVLCNVDHPNADKRGQILEHRYVKSNQIGRPLTSKENVHHLNGIKIDNREENLELWNKHQPSGQRSKDKVDFALEMLKLYRPDLWDIIKDIDGDCIM